MPPSLPPRFLLPGLSPMWRSAARPSTNTLRAARRHASSTTPKTPKDKATIVLEKPARFNPPSHGTRLPRKQPPKVYGGGTTEGERLAQQRRDYPGLMPPKGSKAYRFINSRALHLTITLGTLSILAVTTFVLNFASTSPFAHLLPPASEFWSSPLRFVGTWIRVLKLHEVDRNARAIADHTNHTNDVAKRAYFRKVHGLDKENPIRNLLGGGDGDEIRPEFITQVTGQPMPGTEDADAGAAPAAGETAAPEEEQKKGKWLGIF